jgi:hypothetical protein
VDSSSHHCRRYSILIQGVRTEKGAEIVLYCMYDNMILTHSISVGVSALHQKVIVREFGNSLTQDVCIILFLILKDFPFGKETLNCGNREVKGGVA